MNTQGLLAENNVIKLDPVCTPVINLGRVVCADKVGLGSTFKTRACQGQFPNMGL